MKFFKHLKVVIKHKHFVFLNACKMGIPWTGLIHDLSKFTPTEFLLSARYYLGDESPTIKEREFCDGFSYVCAHHTGRNKHHWQYWIDYDGKNMVINRIPYKNSVEYVCDIMAASRVYHPKNFKMQVVYDYFTRNMNRYLMHPATKEFIVKCLTLAMESGFKKLKKKHTRVLYQKVSSKYPNTILIPIGEINDKLKYQIEI